MPPSVTLVSTPHTPTPLKVMGAGSGCAGGGEKGGLSYIHKRQPSTVVILCTPEEKSLFLM